MPQHPKPRITQKIRRLLDAIHDNDNADRLVREHKMAIIQLHEPADVPSDLPLDGIVHHLRGHVQDSHGAVIICDHEAAGLGANKNITARPGLLIRQGERTENAGFAYVCTVATMNKRPDKFGVGFTVWLQFLRGEIQYRAVNTPENRAIMQALISDVTDKASVELATMALKDYAFRHVNLVLRAICAAYDKAAQKPEATHDGDADANAG